MDIHFKHPFTCIVAGPTKAGKTSFVKQLIRNKERMIFPVPEKIMWCYTQDQPTYTELANDVLFIQGFPDLHLIKENRPAPQLLILDDLMQEFKTNPRLTELFTKGCHHLGLSVIHIVQNIFFTGLRTARVNSVYLVFLKNPSDRVEVQTIARQVFPNKNKNILWKLITMQLQNLMDIYTQILHRLQMIGSDSGQLLFQIL